MKVQTLKRLPLVVYNVKRSVSTVLLGIGLSGIAITALLGLFWVPSVKSESMNAPEAQRILYLHVPAAWTSFLAFTGLLIGSLGWFMRRSDRGWNLHRACARLALLYGTIVLGTGMIWGAVEWGTPWDWGDVRLNSFAVLTALAASLVLLHTNQPDDGSEARDVAATIGIFGFLLVPLTYIATKLWEVRHPGHLIGPASDGAESGLPNEMLIVWMIGFAAFSVFFAGQLLTELKVQSHEDRMERVLLDQDRGV